MSKVKVNGPNADNVYKYMKKVLGVENLEWNFEYFLLDGEGNVLEHDNNQQEPNSFIPKIERLLN